MKRAFKPADKVVDTVTVELGTNKNTRFCTVAVYGTKTFNLRVEASTYMECGFLVQRKLFEMFPQLERLVHDAIATVAEVTFVNAKLKQKRASKAKARTATDPRAMLLGLDEEYRNKAATFRGKGKRK